MTPLRLACMLGLLAIAACTEPTTLRNEQTAQTVTCWNPLYEIPLYAAFASADSQRCVHRYEAAGYDRVPTP